MAVGYFAGVAELVDAHDSKSGLARGGGWRPPSGTRKETKSVSPWFSFPAIKENHGISGTPRASRAWRVRFEPNIFWREDFLEGKSLDFAISSSTEASFIHLRMGSSHTAASRSKRRIFSCTDFFVDIKARLRSRYSSRSMSCSTKRSVRRAILPSKSAIFARIA